MAKRWMALVAGGTVLVYAAAIAVGVHTHSLAYDFFARNGSHAAWRAPALRSVASGDQGDRIRRGWALFNETPIYAAAYTSARLSCASCHPSAGAQPWAAPVVGSTERYPQFSPRAQRVITLQDRIDECMTRSENGRPLDFGGDDMAAMVAYITWLSAPQKAKFVGKGLAPIPVLVPDPAHGAQIYTAQCSGCHGANGEGTRHIYPPLWGESSFNDGAGMGQVTKMAAFVKMNMPQNRKGILSAQDAYDVAAYIHAQPRPKFDERYAMY
jgi:thiosulfate dehydrogenase